MNRISNANSPNSTSNYVEVSRLPDILEVRVDGKIIATIE
jgi:hypothetical protein